MQTAYVGIDPGNSGALALFLPESIEVCPMPEDEQSVYLLLKELCEGYWVRAVIEKLTGYAPARSGDAGSPGSHMFAMGRTYWGLRMALTVLLGPEGHVWWAVPAITWQTQLDLSSRRLAKRGIEGGNHKSRLRDAAQALYPSLNLTLKNCDAVLMAHYCKEYKCDGADTNSH